MTISRSIAVMLLVACLGGCGGQAVPDPKADVDRNDGERGVTPEVVSVDPDLPETNVPNSKTSAGGQTGSTEAREAAGSSQSADAGLPSVSERRERFLLLLPSRPLIVDLIVTIHGQPHDVALRRLVDRDLASADINRDGQTTWKELANSTRFRYGEFEYNPAPMMQMFDADQDYMVDPGEFLRFLDRNAGATKSFVLRSSNEYRYRSRSRVRQLLDDDRDDVITTQEMEGAVARLRQFDADDDEVLTMADLNSDAQPTTGLLTGRLSEQPDVALQISDRTDWGYIWYSLSELYSMGGQVAAADISLTPDVAASLDADQDGTVSDEELKGLMDVPPHLTVKASFGQDSGSAEPSKERVQLQAISEHLQEMGVTAGRHVDYLAFSMPDARVTFFVTEDPMLYNAALDDVDVNRDGKVADYELARFMQRRQDTVGGLVRAWVAGHEDSLFAALDTGGDGILNARELRAATDRLKELDRNADGRLETHEVPEALIVGLLRGSPQRDTELFVMPSSYAPAGASRSRWFTAMDSNRDGEISRREFPGTPDQFQRLDRDADGFIGPAEAIHAQET